MIDYPTAVPKMPNGLSRNRQRHRSVVVVTEVEQGTPAWRAGLRPGMLISKVDQMLVRTPRVQTAVAGKSGPGGSGRGQGGVRCVRSRRVACSLSGDPDESLAYLSTTERQAGCRLSPGRGTDII